MNKIYCTECAAKHEFEAGKKPKFCSECAHPFGGTGKVATKKVAPPVQEPDEDLEEDDEEDEDDTPLNVPRRLKARWSDREGNSFSFGELYNNPSREGRFQRPGTDQTILEHLKKRATSPRNTPVDID